jgi:branched-chain amino acid transport system ATP-binding protein
MGILETENLSVAYGGVRAVDSVSISIEPGALVGLIGPNGAGKTSFLDGVTGLVQAKGKIMFDDQSISHLSAYQRARKGLRRTWQSVELFDDLTVGENLAVGARPVSSTLRSALSDMVTPRQGALRSRSIEALRIFALEEFVDAMPRSLPLGVQKLVGVSRALAAKPRVVALDEPAAGLSRPESAEFGRHLRLVADAGIAVLLVDHDMDLVLSVCDYIYVLDFGKVIGEGSPSEIRRDKAVISAYLGHDVQPEGSLNGTAGDARSEHA